MVPRSPRSVCLSLYLVCFYGVCGENILSLQESWKWTHTLERGCSTGRGLFTSMVVEER